MADVDDTQDGASGEDGADTGSEDERESSADTGTGAGDEGEDRQEGEGKKGASEDVDSLRQKLAKANHEAAKFRRERNDARSELDKAREKDLTEVEREKKRADDAEKRLTEQMERVQKANLAVAIAQRSEIVDVETATLLLRDKGITFDDDGNPENIGDAIDELVKDKPFLVAKGKTRRTSGDTNGGAGNEDSPEGAVQLTADELAIARSFKMTPEEYTKYKDVRPSA